jgi:phenylpropionate dioxygenase-like ring-hydroxylating dioxygenase large terminal subunit
MVMSRDTEMGQRLLSHLAEGTSDSADEIVQMPVSHYLDSSRWEREMQNIFKRLPLMLAFGVELQEPGSYKALEVVGVPVLMVRGRDGEVRAFMNVCRHRGSRLTDEGTGKCRRIVCPYHGWAYDDHGELVGIHKAEQFGEIDRKTRSLIALPCEERVGLVFVGLTPGSSLELDSYLGGMQEELATLGIEHWQVYARRELESANWKAVHDGYVDGYHLEVLHPNSVGQFTKGALNTYESFGPHQRIGFANQDIEKLRSRPPEQWRQDEGFGFVRTLFPNVSFAVRTGVGGLVSQLLPGPTPNRSRTLQTFLRADMPQTEQEVERLDREVETFHSAVRDEDYVTVAGVQRGMESGAISEVTFGRNEVGNQRLHQWIDYYAQDDPRNEDRPS